MMTDDDNDDDCQLCLEQRLRRHRGHSLPHRPAGIDPTGNNIVRIDMCCSSAYMCSCMCVGMCIGKCIDTNTDQRMNMHKLMHRHMGVTHSGSLMPLGEWLDCAMAGPQELCC